MPKLISNKGSSTKPTLPLRVSPNAGIDATVVADSRIATAYPVRTRTRMFTRRNRCSAAAAGPSMAIWRVRRAIETAIISIIAT
jgi:hypothetical protein